MKQPILLVTGLLAAGCAALPPAPLAVDPAAVPAPVADVAAPEDESRAVSAPSSNDALVDELEKQHFQYFVRNSDPVTGLTRDRSQAWSPASVACSGFALTAYGIASKRGWTSRQDAAAFTRKVLTTFSKGAQGPDAQGMMGYKGFYYHWLEMGTGKRTWDSELSTIDTALFLAGVRFARAYYDQAAEADIRKLADQLDARVDWQWAMAGRPLVSHGWKPGTNFLPYDWLAPDEGMIMMLLALGSTGKPAPASAWTNYMAKVKPQQLYGQNHVVFGPQFGHHYSHGWVDFKGINDAVTKKLGWDWYENARRATLAQYQYAKQNPKGWTGYGANSWGLTACDGPGDAVKGVKLAGKAVTFSAYSARGINASDLDDGTIAPTAVAASLPYAPDLVLPTLTNWKKNRTDLWGPDGWADAYNDTAKWVDGDRLGIDQGPIVIMLENYRSGFVWETMKKDPVVKAGLQKAGFTGGWLGK